MAPGSAGICPHDRVVTHALRKSRAVDPYFVGKFSFSPYQACSHGCRYCDGRAERYWIDGVFDRDIVVRRNVADVLAVELGKLRERGIVFVGSGVSDAYQPIEAEARLMSACGRILADHRMPVTLLTKSSLVARDLDTWAELNRTAGFLLMMSLVTLDEGVRRTFEPGAGSIAARLETLERFRRIGCATGVAAMPLLPYLMDSDADLAALASTLAKAGIDFVMPGGLTLRPGRQKDAFFETLRASHPDLVPRYERLYGENRESGAPLRAYADDIHRRSAAACAREGLPTVVPHRLYRGRLPVYDEVDVLLQQLPTLYAHQPEAVRRLDAPRRRYHDWLLGRKTYLNRHRNMREADLARELEQLAASDAWPSFLGSDKLARFLREVILDRRVFDPRTLHLADPPGPEVGLRSTDP